MKKVILDCDLMKHPHSGFYHYCLNLGIHVEKLMEQEDLDRMHFYVPAGEKAFENPRHTIKERGWHKILKPFLWDCNVWHASLQSARIIPDKRLHPKIKVLLTIHDFHLLHENQPATTHQKCTELSQRLIDRCDAIVCVSEFCRQDVLKNCDIKEKPVYVIHNGSNKVHTAKLNNSSYKPARPFLFGLGYVNARKNYQVLLPLLQNQGIELLIAGKLDDPDYIDQMKKEAVAMGVANRLKILGPITEGEKGWYYQHCLAFVHPSLAEGFAAPLVEAMQFGKPLFLSTLTSLPEIGGEVAFYFTSFESEHMRKVFHEEMHRYEKEQLSIAITKRGRFFDWNEKAKEYLKVYRSLY